MELYRNAHAPLLDDDYLSRRMNLYLFMVPHADSRPDEVDFIYSN
jgi:hypothetical protein